MTRRKVTLATPPRKKRTRPAALRRPKGKVSKEKCWETHDGAIVHRVLPGADTCRCGHIGSQGGTNRADRRRHGARGRGRRTVAHERAVARAAGRPADPMLNPQFRRRARIRAAFGLPMDRTRA